MIHLNELFFCEIVLPNGPFRGYDWEQQLGGEKAVRRILSKFNYETTSTHVCCIFFLQTCLYS
jgi:hypothetical protein